MLKSLFSIPTDLSHRVYGLDILRALAIIIVVDAHGAMAFQTYYDAPAYRFFLPDGVELFFVLSGFLIGGILIRSYEKEGGWSGRNILNFWTRRWFRTLPAYLLVLTILVILWMVDTKIRYGHFVIPLGRKLLTYPFFLQNLTTPTPGFFNESWSLAIEEWSYLLLPTTLLLLHGLMRGAPRRTVVLTLVLAFILLTNALRLYKALQLPTGTTEVDVRGIVLMRLDAIAYGVLGAFIKQYYPTIWHNRKIAIALFIIGVAAVLTISFTSSIWMLHVFHEYQLMTTYVFYKHTFYFLAMGVSMLLLLPFMDSIRTGRGWLARFITHVSLVSYSMYLINLSLLMGLVFDRIPTTSLAVGWAKYIGFWLAVIGLATLLYKYFEKPMTDLRERISRKEPKLVAQN